MLPLTELKVLDLTRLIPGGYATLILADLGARVIKVEDPRAGDYARRMGADLAGAGALYQALNRNKKSIKVDLKTPEGREVFMALLSSGYDVVIEGFRPGVMERLGLGYGELRRIAPRLVYCAVSGFGQTGPYRNRAVHDINCMALAGVLGLTGPGSAPLPGVADTVSALHAAVAVLAACMRREITGEGCFIDVALSESLISTFSFHLLNYMAEGAEPVPGESEFTGRYPCYGLYATKDGAWVSFAALEEKFWKNFCRAVARPDLESGQYDTSGAVKRELQRIFASRTRAEWEDLAAELDLCLEPVLSFGEVLSHPQFRERGVFFDIPIDGDKLPQVRLPALFDGAPPPRAEPPPRWGEHTEEVLKALGYAEDEIARMLAAWESDGEG